MNFENPTRLCIGMHGDLAGRAFQLTGRAVMGAELDGETRYWNEFHLETTTGETATLAYEVTKSGGRWRLFTEFKPEHPLTVAGAVRQRAGSKLNLTGINVSVTQVQNARIHHLEGVAPAGRQVGSEVNYFIAEAGAVMQVVSWTDQEVKYYDGHTLVRGTVDAAFNLPRQSPATLYTGLGDRSTAGDSGSLHYLATGTFILMLVVILFTLNFMFGPYSSSPTRHDAATVKRIPVPPPPFLAGASESWGGENFHVTARAAMEVAGAGSAYERNEYELTDETGGVHLLVCGEKPGAKDWTLYLPVTPLTPATPQQSAAHKVGDTVNVNGVVATINERFRFTVKALDKVAATGWHQGDTLFGYTASSQHDWLLVRWDSQRVSFWRGQKVFARDFTPGISATNTPDVSPPVSRPAQDQPQQVQR
ncbi:MAG: hypothetical protein P4N60_05945 [Verrucomicrobiae bacterium]|nr:hypothetical protein [Verrucomicrobiae bacterium]